MPPHDPPELVEPRRRCDVLLDDAVGTGRDVDASHRCDAPELVDVVIVGRRRSDRGPAGGHDDSPRQADPDRVDLVPLEGLARVPDGPGCNVKRVARVF